MSEIKVSVIIPVYNVEKYLDQCLTSVINQTLKDIEIIVVNDGSTDTSLEIIKKYLFDSRIILINKENGGISSARNAGLNLAKGEYIQFLDGDDWLDCDYLEKNYQYAKKNNLDIITSGIVLEYEDKSIFYNKNINKKKIYTKDEYFDIIFCNKDTINVATKFYKLSLYKKNDIFFPENISLGEDLVICVKTVYFSLRIGVNEEVNYHYIQRNRSLSRGLTLEAINELFLCFEVLVKFFQKNNSKYLDGVYMLSLLHLSKFLKCRPIFNQNYFKRCEDFIKLVKQKEYFEKSKILKGKKKLAMDLVRKFPFKITIFLIANFFCLKEKIISKNN